MPGYANFVGGSKHKVIDRRIHPELHAQKKYIAARQFPYLTRKEQGLNKEDLTFSFGWAPMNTLIETRNQKEQTLWQKDTHGHEEMTVEKSKVSKALVSDPVISFERNRRRLLAETDWVGVRSLSQVLSPPRVPLHGLELGYKGPSSSSVYSTHSHGSISITRSSSPLYINDQLLQDGSLSKLWNISPMTRSAQREDGERQEDWELDDKPIEEHEYMRSDTMESHSSSHSLYLSEQGPPFKSPTIKPPEAYCNPFLPTYVQEIRCDDAFRSYPQSHKHDQPQQGPTTIMQDIPLKPLYQIDSSCENSRHLDQSSAFSRSSSASQPSLTTRHDNSSLVPCSQSSPFVKNNLVHCDLFLPNPFRALSVLTGLPDISGDAICHDD